MDSLYIVLLAGYFIGFSSFFYVYSFLKNKALILNREVPAYFDISFLSAIACAYIGWCCFFAFALQNDISFDAPFYLLNVPLLLFLCCVLFWDSAFSYIIQNYHAFWKNRDIAETILLALVLISFLYGFFLSFVYGAVSLISWVVVVWCVYGIFLGRTQTDDILALFFKPKSRLKRLLGAGSAFVATIAHFVSMLILAGTIFYIPVAFINHMFTDYYKEGMIFKHCTGEEKECLVNKDTCLARHFLWNEKNKVCSDIFSL